MQSAWFQQIENAFWPKGPRRDTWAILDGARDRRIFGFLLNSYLNYSCLYAGTLPPELEIAAPYLVQLEYQDRFTRELIEQAWGNQWGIFLKADTGMQKLRRHLRGFLMVQDSRGRRLVFRYYDPRVMRVYLPTCTGEELRAVYGPIATIWTEPDPPEALLEFHFDGRKLLERRIEPPSPGSPAPSPSAMA